MRVLISANEILFAASVELSDAVVVIRSLSDGAEVIIENRAQQRDGITADGEVILVSFSLLDFNALTHTIVVRKNGAEQNFEGCLAKFRLDKNQMDSHYYVTVHLFGAGMKRLDGSDLFYQVLCYMKVMPVTWQFYGGLITLAAFRIADELEGRKNFIDFLAEKHQVLVAEYRPVSDHSVRWLISSSYNLAVISLYLRKYDVVETLLDRSINKGALNRTFPLTYMNFAQSLLLAAIIKFYVGKRSEALHLFLECADFCSFAMGEIFNLRNKFLLQHEMDARIILDAGYAAFKASVLLTGDRFASDSKVADFKVEPARAGRLDFNVVAKRYERQLGAPPILSEIAMDIARLSN